jgi:hypothetical protein
VALDWLSTSLTSGARRDPRSHRHRHRLYFSLLATETWPWPRWRRRREPQRIAGRCVAEDLAFVLLRKPSARLARLLTLRSYARRAHTHKLETRTHKHHRRGACRPQVVMRRWRDEVRMGWARAGCVTRLGFERVKHPIQHSQADGFYALFAKGKLYKEEAGGRENGGGRCGTGTRGLGSAASPPQDDITQPRPTYTLVLMCV